MAFKKICWECGKPASGTFCDYTYDSFGDNDGARFLMPLPALSKSEEEVNNIDEDICQKISIPRMYCKECLSKKKAELEGEKKRYVLLKKKLMFERALRILERQNINMYDYKDIVDDMQSYVEENPEKFDSSHEIIAAIILVDNELESRMQYKIGKYRVDFYIPQLKVVLEIDGNMHKNTLFKDNKRDEDIRKILGSDWETVRISTNYLEENAEMLVEAIIAIRKEKQKIRKQNYGILPEWYSERNKAKRKRSFNVGDDDLFDL